jgi:hypothetical protein
MYPTKFPRAETEVELRCLNRHIVLKRINRDHRLARRAATGFILGYCGEQYVMYCEIFKVFGMANSSTQIASIVSELRPAFSVDTSYTALPLT